MTNFEISVEILNTMIAGGYAMFGETAEHMIKRTTDDPNFWEMAKANFLGYKKAQK